MEEKTIYFTAQDGVCVTKYDIDKIEKTIIDMTKDYFDNLINLFLVGILNKDINNQSIL